MSIGTGVSYLNKTLRLIVTVKVQREALAESSVVFGRVFGNKSRQASYGVKEGLFTGIATSTVQVSHTQGIRSHVHNRSHLT